MRRVPGLVVCSRTAALVEREALAWVELYPDHASGPLASLAGEKTAFEAVSLDALGRYSMKPSAYTNPYRQISIGKHP